MPKLIVDGLPPWDGEYPFDNWLFTNRELHRIKQLSGIRAGELFEAIEAGDSDVAVIVAAVVLARHGKHADVEDLWDAQVGVLKIDMADEQEDDARPPELTPGDAGLSRSEPSSGASS